MKFYEIIYEGEHTGELQTTEDLRKEFEEAKKTGDDYGDETLEAYIEDQIVNGEIEEVDLSTEEIENLLTEEQNQITLETLLPYDMTEDKDDDYYDNHMLLFTVPYSWYRDYIEENYKPEWLRGYHEPKERETLDESFLQEYAWDDTDRMYGHAVTDHVLMKETIVTRTDEKILWTDHGWIVPDKYYNRRNK